MFAVLAEDAPPRPVGDDAQRRLDEIEKAGRAKASQIAQLQAELVDLAAETTALSGHLYAMSAGAWLAWAWGLSPRESGRLVWLARRLPQLPLLADAFAEGRLSEDVVSSMTAVATPDNEAELVATSEVATGAQLRTLIRDFRRVHPDPKVRAEHHCSRVEDDGMRRGSYLLSPDHGAVFDAAMRAAREVDAESGPQPRLGRSRPERPRPLPRGRRVLASGRHVPGRHRHHQGPAP